jgi:hypothetical protein
VRPRCSRSRARRRSKRWRTYRSAGR